mgnify:CR=1 FL=1
MASKKLKSPKHLSDTLAQLKKLGLQNCISELELNGFTIIPPRKVASTQFFNKIRKTVLRICEERKGKKFSLSKNGKKGKYKAQPQTDSQFLLYYLLMADPIFEKWLMNPTLNAMMNYLMKGTQQLSSMTSFVKWQGDGYGETLGVRNSTRMFLVRLTEAFIPARLSEATQVITRNQKARPGPASHLVQATSSGPLGVTRKLRAGIDPW